MPFDTTPGKPDFSFATGDTGLLRLAMLLDNEQEWRDSIMEWDFLSVTRNSLSECGTAGCALGLAKLVWPEFKYESARSLSAFSAATRIFEIDSLAAQYIFSGGFTFKPFCEINPRDVVAAIREFVYARNPAATI